MKRSMTWSPHGLKPVLARRSSLQHAGVAPPHASSGGTLRSIPHYAPLELRWVPSRIHPWSEDRGSLRRRVDYMEKERCVSTLQEHPVLVVSAHVSLFQKKLFIRHEKNISRFIKGWWDTT